MGIGMILSTKEATFDAQRLRATGKFISRYTQATILLYCMWFLRCECSSWSSPSHFLRCSAFASCGGIFHPCGPAANSTLRFYVEGFAVDWKSRTYVFIPIGFFLQCFDIYNAPLVCAGCARRPYEERQAPSLAHSLPKWQAWLALMLLSGLLLQQGCVHCMEGSFLQETNTVYPL